MGCASSKAAPVETEKAAKKLPLKKQSSSKGVPGCSKEASQAGCCLAGRASSLTCCATARIPRAPSLPAQPAPLCPCPTAERTPPDRLLSLNTGAVFGLGPDGPKGVETRLRRLSAPVLPQTVEVSSGPGA